MEINRNDIVTEREVITVVEDRVEVYDLKLNREEAELLLALCGSLTGVKNSGSDTDNDTAFKLCPLKKTVGYPGMPMDANPDDLRKVLTSPLFDRLNVALRSPNRK